MTKLLACLTVALILSSNSVAACTSYSGCKGCTVVEGASNPNRRTRNPDTFHYERRWVGEKNRGDGHGKPREYRDRRRK